MKKKLAQGAIATGTGTLAYTVPTTPKTVYVTTVKIIDITNTTVGALTVRIHLVPVGVAVGATNALVYDLSVAANTKSSVLSQGDHVLNTGDFIQCIASGAGLVMNISGEVEKE